MAPTVTHRVAFLRGINVGGSGLLKMKDLARLASELGFGNAVTVGASGNLLYESRGTPKSDEENLVRALVAHMGKGVVVIRDVVQMAALARTDRFAKAAEGIPDKWCFVALLQGASAEPLPDVPADGSITILGRTSREVFYTMSTPSSAAINMARVLERALGTPVTVRNWNVVRDIAKRLSA